MRLGGSLPIAKRRSYCAGNKPRGRWVAGPNEIIAAVRRGHQVLDHSVSSSSGVALWIVRFGGKLMKLSRISVGLSG